MPDREDVAAGGSAGAWFGLAALLAAAFAITAASRWSTDDLEGRLAEELSAPVSCARVAIERLATLLA